ncbi:hypothetical protein IQ241_21080 [Romeria aff. gracilis LEGE 07310]|uniref:Uncharacterized protein n=1 Tax=Vasconcelosia minhoensis LEGE 07310 TaxID=915328 RepID=A0A8J7ASV1_9CYAN|nr:hypothetical protein [Romeria gracilis]MBE9079755.1 hypothetical protein [Romeria aff. gracilis LEGE 07310]
MARYTNFFITGSSLPEVHQSLVAVLQSCDLTLVYEDSSYIVAKEKPGQVSFGQLATVELLINPPTTQSGAKVDLVVKNEELPLRAENHCHDVFQVVNQAISDAAAT